MSKNETFNMALFLTYVLFMLSGIHEVLCADGKRPAWTPQGRMGKRLAQDVFSFDAELGTKRASWVPQGRFGKRSFDPSRELALFSKNLLTDENEKQDNTLHQFNRMTTNKILVELQAMARALFKSQHQSLSSSDGKTWNPHRLEIHGADDGFTTPLVKRASWVPQGRFGKKWTPQGRFGKRTTKLVDILGPMENLMNDVDEPEDALADAVDVTSASKLCVQMTDDYTPIYFRCHRTAETDEVVDGAL